MKKFLFSILTIMILFTSGCNKIGNSPTKKVEELMSKYQSLDDDVLDDLNKVVNSEEDLSDKQKEEYKDLLKNQYEKLTYTIKNEKIDGDNATVETEIEVLDLTTALKEAEDYLNSHEEEFQGDDGKFSKEKYTDYKLEKMKDAKNRVKYTLELTLTKTDDEWKLDNLTETERQKIHGIYNY